MRRRSVEIKGCDARIKFGISKQKVNCQGNSFRGDRKVRHRRGVLKGRADNFGRVENTRHDHIEVRFVTLNLQTLPVSARWPGARLLAVR